MMQHDEIVNLDEALTDDQEFAKYSQIPEDERLFLESQIRLELSDFMKTLREKNGITQSELAKRVGRTQPLIAKLEAGAYDRMGFSGIRTYARAMGSDFVSVSRMFKRLSEAVFTGESSDVRGITYKHLIDTIDYSHWTDSQELPTISPSITKPDVAA